MPVPDTYSRRSVREEIYTFSTRSSRPSSYLSKYSSTLPPRPPLYERKISDLNTSSTTGSRFLNGSSRAGSTYGSSYVRSSVSPVRATSSLRRNLDGGSTTTTSSISDRLRALELSGEKEPIYKFSRNKDRDSTGGGTTTTSTGTKSYGSYGSRDRSGSRELTSSPLISSPMTLGSRDSLSNNLTSRSRSSSTTGTGVGGTTTTTTPGTGSPVGSISTTTTSSPYGRTSRSSNGVMSRLITSEVNKPSSVVSSSSSSDSTTTSATPTKFVKNLSKNEGDDVDSMISRDVENNDEGSSSSSAVDSSASPPLSNDEVISLHMNGNDKITDKDFLSSSSPSSNNDNDNDLNDDMNKKMVKERGKSDSGSFNSIGGGGSGGVVLGVDESVTTSTTIQDSNGNPINVDIVHNHNTRSSASPPPSNNHEDEDDRKKSMVVSSSVKELDKKNNGYSSSNNYSLSSSRNHNNRSHFPDQAKNDSPYSQQTVPKTTTNSDSNANLVTTTEDVKNFTKSPSSTTTSSTGLTGSTCGVTAAGDLNIVTPSLRKSSLTTTTTANPEIGVKKSLLKPNNLSSTKVQPKSKIIIHKFSVEDGPSTSPSIVEVSPPEKKILSVKSIITTSSSTSPDNSSSSNYHSSSGISISRNKSPEISSLPEGSTSASFTITRKKSTGEKRHSNGMTSTKTPASTILTSTTPGLNTSPTPTNKVESDEPDVNTQQNLDFVKNKKYGSNLVAHSSSPPPSSITTTSSSSTSSSDSDRNKVPSAPIKRESTSPFKDEELARVKIAKSQHQASTSRSPSPAVPNCNTNTNSNTNSNNFTKVPSPPPLPQLLHRQVSPAPLKRDEQKYVGNDMAGPHSSKYSSPHQGKTDHHQQQQSDRSSSVERDTTTRSDRATRNNHAYANTSDSSASDNDSEGYSPSPQQIGGRFRSRESEKAGLTGLRNIGNTCFMNSVLQCLSNTKPLLEYLLQDNYEINTTTSSMKGALIRAFSQVIQELWRETRTVDTSAFKDQIQRFAPRFMGYSQQDAQEFLRYLLEGLHEDVNRVTVKPKPITTDIDDSLSDSQKAAESWKRYLRYDDSKIVDIFVGQLKSTLKCTTCGHCSVTFDPFWDLSLPIPARPNQTKLSNCFELFTREEILDGDEKPTCSKCQCRRKCTKSLSIQKFPKILVVHLKRFSPTERYRGKLSTTVDYPIKGLDLSAFAANPGQSYSSYNLYGLSNHSGSTYSGHYVAYCKHPYSGQWNCYNDSRVSTVPSQHIVSSEGYVLFYESAVQSSHP